MNDLRLRDAQDDEPWMESARAVRDLRWVLWAAVLGAVLWVPVILWVLA